VSAQEDLTPLRPQTPQIPKTPQTPPAAGHQGTMQDADWQREMGQSIYNNICSSPSVGTINLSVVAINPSVGIPSLQWNYQPFSGEYV